MMKKPFRLTFSLHELLLLMLEMNLGFAGLVMIAAALTGQPERIYAPVRSMFGMLPAVACVAFAAWLVYRLQCVRKAPNRRAGLLGAFCLGVVSLSFGAAVGKLTMICVTDGFRDAVELAISSPLQQQAGMTSMLAFISIGLVFGVTFVCQAGRQDRRLAVSNESLHAQIDEIGQQVLPDWSTQLVTRIDSLVECGKSAVAASLYSMETGVDRAEAERVIADWPEQRLRLQLELLRSQLPQAVDARKDIATTASSGSHDAGPPESLT